MKKLISVAVTIFCITGLWSQSLINSKSAIAYRNALASYDDKAYGDALNYAEDAITYRNEQVASEIKTLEASLSTREVKAAGDKINQILSVLETRNEYDCINIINTYLKRRGSAYFNNSISKLLEYIKVQKSYPEAQKLIGDIYKIEGEYDFAEQYYLTALKDADVLDVPDEKYEILYTMAELSRLSGNYEQMETRLLNITASANQSKNRSVLNSAAKVISVNKKDSLEKIFTMYRCEDYYNLDAYCQLAQYYFDKGLNEKALGYCSLSVITGFTKMYNLISKRDMAFEYKDIESFLLEVQNYDDIVNWGINNRVWESFNMLAKIAAKMNYNVFADTLLRTLAKASPEKYWQEEAVLLLDTVDGIQ